MEDRKNIDIYIAIYVNGNGERCTAKMDGWSMPVKSTQMIKQKQHKLAQKREYKMGNEFIEWHPPVPSKSTPIHKKLSINPKKEMSKITQNTLRFPIGAFAFALILSTASGWGYGPDDGPSTWPGICQSGKNQSPVNIVTGQAEKNTKIGTIDFRNYNQAAEVEVENNGHGVEVSGFANWQNRPSIEGGGLGAKYLLNQFHFHWSQQGNGSEHQLDGSHYPLEAHLVHVKEGLTLEQALGQSNGIAVLGILYQIGQNGSSMAKLADGALSDVVEYEDVTIIEDYSPSVHLPGNVKHFYRYNGSLTTPDCQEAVVWTVFPNVLSITQQQMDKLRAIKDSHGQVMQTNVRPVQPLNSRKVQYREAN